MKVAHLDLLRPSLHSSYPNLENPQSSGSAVLSRSSQGRDNLFVLVIRNPNRPPTEGRPPIRAGTSTNQNPKKGNILAPALKAKRGPSSGDRIEPSSPPIPLPAPAITCSFVSLFPILECRATVPHFSYLPYLPFFPISLSLFLPYFCPISPHGFAHRMWVDARRE